MWKAIGDAVLVVWLTGVGLMFAVCLLWWAGEAVRAIVGGRRGRGAR